MSRRNFSIALCLAFLAPVPALAELDKHDRKVEAAAAEIAAEKLGELRPTISYEDIRPLVTFEGEEKQAELEQPAPKYKIITTTVPPVTDAQGLIDTTVTGSVAQPEPKQRIIWEKFDRYGNPID